MRQWQDFIRLNNFDEFPDNILPEYEAWDIHNKKMVKVNHLLLDTKELFYEGDLDEPKAIHHFVLRQKSPFLDMKAKPLYDHDIVSIYERNIAVVHLFLDPNTRYGVGWFLVEFQPKREPHPMLIRYDFLKNVEKKGNIFENINLLK